MLAQTRRDRRPRRSAKNNYLSQVFGTFAMFSPHQSLALWEWPRPASLAVPRQFTFRWRHSRRRGFYSKTCFLTLSPATAGALPKGEPYAWEPYFQAVKYNFYSFSNIKQGDILKIKLPYQNRQGSEFYKDLNQNVVNSKIVVKS